MKPAGHIKADLHIYKSDARAFHVSGPLCNMLCVEDIVRVLLTVSLNVVWYRVTCVCVHYFIPEKRKFSGILCFRQQRRRRRVTISLSAR